METSIPCINLNIQTDFKLLKDVPHPEFLNHKDAVDQYYGIWKLFWMYVYNMKAKKVLEFGTREGYSTQLFSNLLRATDGHLWTVDLADHKIPKEIAEKMDNVTFIKEDVTRLGWLEESWFQEDFDILYIDDWHNPYHLFGELDRFAKYARVIIIHDIVQNWQTHEWLIPPIFSWCHKEFLPFIVYPLNSCGIVAIHREEFQNFYQVEK